MRIEFIVPGEPVAKQRPRLSMRGGAYTPKKTVRFENKVGLCYVSAVRESETWVDPDPNTPLSLAIWSVFPLPSNAQRAKRLAGMPYMKTPDADNLLKSVADGLNKLAYDDDKVVVCAAATKRWARVGESARTIVRLETWNHDCSLGQG